MNHSANVVPAMPTIPIHGIRAFGIAQTLLAGVVTIETWAGSCMPSLELEKCDEASYFRLCSVRRCAHFHRWL
jgi:hypothetical protein